MVQQVYVVFLETDVKVVGTENNKTEPNRATQLDEIRDSEQPDYG